MKHLLLLGTLLVLPACQSAPPSAADLRRLQDANAMLDKDPDAGLAIADELLATHPDWRQARLLVATGSLRMAQDPARDNRELLLQDAIAGFERAAELDDHDAECLLQLAEARLQAGQDAEAEAAAEQAVQLLGDDAVEFARANLVAARAELALLIAARRSEQTGDPEPNGLFKPARATAELAAKATARLKLPQVLATSAAASYRLSAQIYQWLDQPDQALTELENGIRQQPDDSGLHLDMQAIYQQMSQQKALCGAYARLVREQPNTPILTWFQGRAQVILADDQRQKGAWQDALVTYDKARQCFARYGAMQPGHAEATADWLAILDLALARTLVEVGDLDGAAQHLFAADAVDADKLLGNGQQRALADSFGNDYQRVAFAIGRALAQGGADRLQKTLAFHTAVLQRHAETWGWVYNNAGLAARDLGVAQEQQAAQLDAAAQQAAHQQAMALWEQSYGWYEIAARLSPEDPRIVNDCGLMLLYHLHRDLDRAAELFHRAIAVGQPQLDKLPPGADSDDRNFLEEAVGDAWQNLAVLTCDHLHRPFAEYRDYCEKALQYYPRRQRTDVVRMLAAGEKAAIAAPAARGKGGPRALAVTFALAQGGQGDEFEELRRKAAAKAEAGDLDAALTELDRGVKSLKDYAPFHALRGDYSLQLAKAAREHGRQGVEFLFADAVSALQRAVELDSEPAGPRLLLAQAQQESGDFAAAASTADRLLLHLQSIGGGKPEQLDAAHAVRAQALARVIADAGGQAKEEQLQQARLSFKYLEQRQQLDAAALKLWSTMEQWAKKPVEAVNVYARALQRAPDDTTLLAGLCDTARSTGEIDPAIAALSGRTDALGVWYLGCCHFAKAATLRTATKNAEAQQQLDLAIGCFDKSMAENRDYTSTCKQWLAWCYGKKGCAAYSTGDVANAEKWLLRSVELKPDEIDTDLGLSETTKLGILSLADKYYKANDLGHVEAIYRAASDAANADVTLLNNAGLFARDYGNQLERQGQTAAARAMYEQSYKAYAQAQRLDPTNVQLCNDTALILIYHLERDWDRARELLDQGIATGEKQLRDDPPEDRQGFQDLDMAVGDSYENLALLHLKHTGDLEAARAAAEASLRHYPKQNRGGARRHLAEIDRREQGK